jgi:hypothetical protein
MNRHTRILMGAIVSGAALSACGTETDQPGGGGSSTTEGKVVIQTVEASPDLRQKTGISFVEVHTNADPATFVGRAYIGLDQNHVRLSDLFWTMADDRLVPVSRIGTDVVTLGQDSAKASSAAQYWASVLTDISAPRSTLPGATAAGSSMSGGTTERQSALAAECELYVSVSCFICMGCGCEVLCMEPLFGLITCQGNRCV